MNSDQKIIVLSLISSYSVIVPIIFGIKYQVQNRSDLKFIFHLLCVSLLVEIISTYLSNKNYNNIVLINIFTFFEFFFLVLFYRQFFNQLQKTSIHGILIFIFLLLMIFTTFLADNLRLIDNFSISIEAIILIIYSLLSFYLIMKNLIYNDILSVPFFWVNIAVLIYFSGNLFLFIFSAYLQKLDQSSVYLKLYMIHSILNILYYLILTVGFWKARKV